MGWSNLLLLMAIVAAQAAELPPPFPRPGTTALLENDAVAVWNVSWLKQQYPLHTHRYDSGWDLLRRRRPDHHTRKRARATGEHEGLGVSDEPRQCHARGGRRERPAYAGGADRSEESGAASRHDGTGRWPAADRGSAGMGEQQGGRMAGDARIARADASAHRGRRRARLRWNGDAESVVRARGDGARRAHAARRRRGRTSSRSSREEP